MMPSVSRPFILSADTQTCAPAWTGWRRSLKHRPGAGRYVPDTLYLFCGRRTDRIKGLVWEGDGWLLLYKRLAEGRFQWPRSPEEVRELTLQQFRWLMEGLTTAPKKSVKPVEPPEYTG